MSRTRTLLLTAAGLGGLVAAALAGQQQQRPGRQPGQRGREPAHPGRHQGQAAQQQAEHGQVGRHRRVAGQRRQPGQAGACRHQGQAGACRHGAPGGQAQALEHQRGRDAAHRHRRRERGHQGRGQAAQVGSPEAPQLGAGEPDYDPGRESSRGAAGPADAREEPEGDADEDARGAEARGCLDEGEDPLRAGRQEPRQQSEDGHG